MKRRRLWSSTPFLGGIAALVVACGGTDTGAAGSGLTCSDYCSAIMAACTGANQQYSDQDHCLSSCEAIPVGSASDTSGNTLGCRIYHTGAAKSDPATHCPHSGPSGGGVCVDP